MTAPRRLIVGISGASGVIYGARLLELLQPLSVETHLVHGFDSGIWGGLMAPAGTPRPVIDKLNKTVDGLNSQFLQLQALSGAALVGRDITLADFAVACRDNGLPANVSEDVVGRILEHINTRLIHLASERRDELIQIDRHLNLQR